MSEAAPKRDDGSSPVDLGATLLQVYRGEDESSQTPPTLPGLRMVSLLGKGGMGSVWLAEVENPDQFRASAMSVLAHATEGTPLERTRLQEKVAKNLDTLITGTRHQCAVKVISGGPVAARETRKFMRYTSPDTPQVYGGTQIIEPDGEKVCLYMEAEPGRDLASILATHQRRPIPLRAASDLAALSSRGLYGAHRAGVLHRDVKPANFYVTDSGRVMILDMGLSKSLDPAVTTETHVGQPFGTPQYMSPEHAKGTMITEKSDVFSLGLMFAEMYTGNTPYRAPNNDYVALLHSRATLEKPMSVSFSASTVADLRAHGLHKEVEKFIERMIHPNPDNRPTMEEVARFFHGRSSFGGESFDDKYMNPESYGDYRLRLAPPLAPKRNPQAYSAYEPADMLRAIDEGARISSETSFDFLSQYRPSAPVERARSSTRVALAASGILLVAIAGGVVALRPTGKPAEGDPAPQKAPDDLKKVVTPEVIKPAPPYTPYPGAESVTRFAAKNGFVTVSIGADKKNVTMVVLKHADETSAAEGENGELCGFRIGLEPAALFMTGLDQHFGGGQSFKRPGGSALRAKIDAGGMGIVRKHMGFGGDAKSDNPALTFVTMGEREEWLLMYLDGAESALMNIGKEAGSPETQKPIVFKNAEDCRKYLREHNMHVSQFTTALSVGDATKALQNGRDVFGREKLQNEAETAALSELHASLQAYLGETFVQEVREKHIP